MGLKATLIAAGVCLLPVASHAAPDSNIYTLYRSSLVDGTLRVHVATFDTNEGAAYNQENCVLAANLFSQQPHVKTQFWCERGRFKHGPS